MKKRNLRHNCQGLSLVELLVASAILGILVFPLLHVFVSSAHTAAKGRRLGDETLAAQNVAETVEATELSRLSDLGSVEAYDSGHHPWKDKSVPAAKYVLYMQDVKHGKYDAKVTLTAADKKEVALYTPIDAVFTQETGDLNPDTMAQAEFQLEAGTLTETEPEYSITRKINIDIEESGDDYEYICTYHYDGSVRYADDDATTVTAELSPVEYSYVFYNGTFDAGKDNALAALYFFFLPFDSGSLYDDTITITHHVQKGNCHAVSVFLAKQTAGGPERSYHLLVQLQGDDEDNTRVYCNVSNSIFRVFRSDGIWYEKKLGYFGKLVATANQYRLYGMTVDIYDKAGNRVYALKGSKLG